MRGETDVQCRNFRRLCSSTHTKEWRGQRGCSGFAEAGSLSDEVRHFIVCSKWRNRRVLPDLAGRLVDDALHCQSTRRRQGKNLVLCRRRGRSSTKSARVAESEKADGLLLPMPDFYPYAQEDLDLFCRTVAGTTRLPVLLYNLAAVHFRTGQGNGEQPRQRSPQYRWNQGFERFTRDSALPHAARCPGLPDRRQRRHARTRTARGNLRWRCLRYCRCCAGSDSRGLCAQTSDRVGRFFFRCTAN